jgi:uncharacterized membrane protein
MVTKSMILPIISVIALLLQSAFHIVLSDTLQDLLATATTDFILVVVSIHGIIKDHHTETVEPPSKDIQLP